MTPIKILFVSILILSFLRYLIYRLRISEKTLLNWPTAQGRILSISIQPLLRPAVSGKASSSTHRYWMVAVSYEFHIGNKQYLGERLSNSPPMENIEMHSQPSIHLQSYLTRYPVGKEITVHYNPDKPEESLLEISR